jgi:hypothetical protein
MSGSERHPSAWPAAPFKSSGLMPGRWVDLTKIGSGAVGEAHFFLRDHARCAPTRLRSPGLSARMLPRRTALLRQDAQTPLEVLIAMFVELRCFSSPFNFVRYRLRVPLPAACRCDTASIQRRSDLPQGRSPGLLCLSDDGQHVGSELIGLGCHGLPARLCSHRELGFRSRPRRTRG